MPIGLILLLAGLAAGGLYAASQGGGDEPAKKTVKKPPPPTLTDQVPGGKSAKVEEVRRKIETVKAKAAQGDKDAGKVLADLKTLYGNLTR